MQRTQPFGPYDLVERIGVGAMGEVFRAASRRDGRVVAIKRLMPFVSADSEVVETLQGEANLARALDHPNVAKVIDVGDVRGTHYIAYEYVHGRDLRAIRERAAKSNQTIPLDVGVHVIAAVALALEHAHTRRDATGRLLGLVHRDVCPSNILVSFEGRVVLSDFGIAKAEGRVAKTEAGQVKGTIGYMSPEQVTGSAIDHRSDIYGLGVCLWELATGARLFEGAPALVVMERIASGMLPAPRARNPSVSPALESVILKSLAQTPDRRYPRAEDFHAHLTSVARAEGYLADSFRVAHYVRGLFPEAAAEGAASRQEFLNMADSKGGSDLDVFEGLAKKSPRSVAPGLTPPPPSTAPRQRTLMGGLMGGPLPPPTSTMPSPGAPPGALPPPSMPKPPGTPMPSAPPSLPPSLPKPLPAPTSTAAAALPPPSRASGAPLPPVSAPPARLSNPTPPAGQGAVGERVSGMGSLPPPTITPLRPPAALPPPSMPKPPGSTSTPLPPPPNAPSIGASLGLPAQAKKKDGKSVDMDWDDEEESTHVYDKQTHDVMPKGMRPAAGTPAVPKVGGAAAALLASSGGAAAAQKSLPPTPTPPPQPNAATLASGPAPSAAPPYVAPPARPNEEPTAVRARPAPAQQAGGSKAGVILGALALLAVLALGAFLLFPRSGQFKIDIKSKSGSPVAKAEIFIDGQKKCDTAPCVVTDLAPGPKTIKVIAPDVPASEPVTETVEAGKEKLVFITIDAAGPATATAGGTGFKAQGPSGVKVLVDGADKGPLPAELKDLAPGSHKVRFEGERYEPNEQTIEVVANQMKDLGPIKLKVLKGMLSLELATAGASVTLMGQGGKKEKKTLDSVLKLGTPVKLSDIDATQSWKLTATKKGFQDFTQDISFDDGQAEKSIRIELVEVGKPAPVAGPVGPAPGPAPGPAEPKEPKETPAAAPASGSGTLNINSIPVSKVVLDGRPLGSTPKVGVSVPAGSHTVTFIHPELGKKSVTVAVKAGETKTAAVKFK